MFKKLKNVTNCKSCVFFIASSEQNIMITAEKNWRERKSVVLI